MTKITADLKRLARHTPAVIRSARALGQHRELLNEIKIRKLHPAMAAFGLWRDASDLVALTEQLYANREKQGARAEIKW